MKMSGVVRLGLAAAMLVAVADTSLAGPLTSWDQRIDAPGRFRLLPQFGGAAVLDQETALVWEREPSESLLTWAGAQVRCTQSTVGGRRGWRAPTITELMSLSDPSQDNPSLPAGHPFLNISTVEKTTGP